MSANLSPSGVSSGTLPLEGSISRLRQGHQYFEKLIDELLEELERVQAALAEREERLEQTEGLLKKAQQELSEAREECQNSAAAGPEVLEKLSESEKERTALELELEAVRLRAAELAETVAEQKRQMTEERAQWTGELRQMRKLLERQPATARSADLPAEAPKSAPPVTGRAAPDPVLGSVMAQFEMLQKDIARRRSKTPKSDPP